MVRAFHDCVQDLMKTWDHWSIHILDIIPFLRVRQGAGLSAWAGGPGALPSATLSCSLPSSFPALASGG